MNTLLFTIGIFVFMISVYGVVMVGGFKLWDIRRRDAAPNATFVINDDGWEVIEARTEARRTATSDAHRDQGARAA